jgi:hypothetical protein
VKLRLEYILDFRNPADKMLHFSSFPETVDDFYENLWKRMERKDRRYAPTIVSWVFYAKRPLRMTELRVAAALSAGNSVDQLSEDFLTRAEDIQECCRGLIIWEKSSDTVRFLHQTVRQYLEKYKMRELLSVDNIPGVCFASLSFEEFERPCNRPSKVEERLQKYKFSGYAAQFCVDTG